MAAVDSDDNLKTAFITGASRGIGFSLTQKLIERGIKVFAVARNTEPLIRLQSTYPEHLRIIQADLSTYEGQIKAADETPPHLDYVVHNAAVINPLGPEALLDPANVGLLATLMQVNIMAPTIINARLGGKITGARMLMVSSKAGDSMVEGLGAYCASKTWMDTYVESLQLDKPKRIVAAAVHPGDVDTGMQADLRKPDETVFPKASYFQEWYSSRKLLPCETSASYLAWLLLSTEDAYFASKKHDIYEASHHSEWLGDRELPFTK